MAADWGKLEILQEIGNLAEDNLTTEEINNKMKLATDERGRTVLQTASRAMN